MDKNGAVSMNWDDGRIEVDCALVAMGRKPNLEGLGLHHLGIDTDADSLPDIDVSCLNIPGTPIYFAGDVSGVRPLLHEAADEGRIAGYNAVRGENTAFARRVPLQITFTEPQIASAGANWKELEPRETEIAVGSASFTNRGRSQLARTGEGAIRIYAEKTSARLLGVELFAQDAEHLAHLFAFALEQGATLDDLLKMPFYHPTYEEVVRSALRDALDECNVKEEPFGLDQFRCNDTPVDTAASGE